MPSLSFDEGKDGKALALVKGGLNDGEVLYLHEDDMGSRKRPKPTFNRLDYAKAFPGLKVRERTLAFAKIEEALTLGKPPTFFDSDPKIKEVYEKVLKDSTRVSKIELDDAGMFVLLPPTDPTKRSVWYVSGQSGSGKSYIAKEVAEYYHKLFPSRGVYLISQLKEDATLDKLKFLKRVNIASLVDDFPEIDEFKDCCVIFDDYNSLEKPELKVVLKLIDTIAIMGRHSNTTMMVLTHHTTNYKETRLILNETTNFVVYPMSTSYKTLKHLLHSYAGVEEDDLKRYKKMGSRWLMISKGFPQVMISQREAEVMHQD